MANPVSAHDVFIASPGGLIEEREAVRKELTTFNEERMTDTGHAFLPRGWEDVAGALGRAQSLLNASLKRCDYLILILADRWGTPPGGDGGYTSGTEEEFELARQLANDVDAPMVDVLLLFKGLPEDRLRDPGPQLQKVLDFKTEREESHDVYYKTFDSHEELRQEIRRALQKWAQGVPIETSPTRAHPDTPEHTSTLSSDVAGASPIVGSLELARVYEEKGLVTQAEHLYAQAVADEEVAALAAYARFLRRTGRPTKSIEVNERILAQLALEADRDTTGERAQILTNIGIARRKLGETAVSRQKLREAVSTARTGTPPDPRALSYALDNLAITMARAGDLDEASIALEESSEIRKDPQFTAEDRAESILNAARLSLKRGDLQGAEELAHEALNLLSSSEPHRLRAAGLLLVGQVEISSGEPAKALSNLRSALEMNEALAAPDYVAMCAHQLSSALLSLGQTADAEKYAERALRENRDASNREGELTSLVLLARVLLADMRAKEAVPLLQEAIRGHSQSQNRRARGWAFKYLADAQAQLGLENEAGDSRERATRLGIH